MSKLVNEVNLYFVDRVWDWRLIQTFAVAMMWQVKADCDFA